MEIKLQNYNKNITSTKYNNRINSTISFQDCLDSAKNNTKNNKIDTSETDQTLIEDKKLYDYLKNRPELSNIEFGSKEWDEWKKESNDNFFPPLDAPPEVREAWREAKESIPKDDTQAQEEFHFKEMLLGYESQNPEKFGLPAGFKLNTLSDYETLFNQDITTNEELAKITGSSENTSLAKITQNVEDKLNEILLKSK